MKTRGGVGMAGEHSCVASSDDGPVPSRMAGGYGGLFR